MKIKFRTYEGVPYFFNPITRKIEKANSVTKTEAWAGGPIFKKILSPSRQEISRKINGGQQILQLNVTEDCSNRCSYCVYSGNYDHERTHRRTFMATETAIKSVAYFFSHSHNVPKVHISFYGGEPLLNDSWKVIKDVISYAAAKRPGGNVTFGMTSNGRHFDKEKIKFFIANKIQLMVSLDGPAEIHNRYRRSKDNKPTFKEVFAGLRKIRSHDEDYYRKNVGLVCVLTPPLYWTKIRDFFNSDSFVKNQNLIISFLNMNDQRLPFTIDSDKFSEQTVSLFKESIQRYYTCAVSAKLDDCHFEKALLHKNLGLLHKAQQEEGGSEISLNGCCIPGIKRCFIGTNGHIYSCEKMSSSHPIGDIDHYLDERKIMGLIQEYKSISEESCLKCWCGNICDLCFVSARKGPLLDPERKEASCQERREYFKALIRLYASLKEKCSPAYINSIMPVFTD